MGVPLEELGSGSGTNSGGVGARLEMLGNSTEEGGLKGLSPISGGKDWGKVGQRGELNGESRERGGRGGG
jgi:hypothetical protein